MKFFSLPLSTMLLASLLACSKKAVETPPLAPLAKAEPPKPGSILPPDELIKRDQANYEARKQRVLANLAELRVEASVPFQLGEDPRIGTRRSMALLDLARSGTQEGVEIVMEVVLSPANEKFWYTPEKIKKDRYQPPDINAPEYAVEKQKADLYMRYCQSLLDFCKYLEGTPSAREGLMFTAEDLPVWREWWAANKERLEFKPLPRKPVWMNKVLGLPESDP